MPLDGPGPIYARDMGDAERTQVVGAFPTRPIWIIGRSPEGGSRLAVLAGPLAPGISPSLEPYKAKLELQAEIP